MVAVLLALASGFIWGYAVFSRDEKPDRLISPSSAPAYLPSPHVRMRGRCTRCLETVDVSHGEVRFGREV